MSTRKAYQLLSEKYVSVLNEENSIREVPFSQDELKVLSALYDFQIPQNVSAPSHLKRIVHPGLVEVLIKYSDDTFVCIEDGARGNTKKEYSSFYDLCQHITKPYKADAALDQVQTPMGNEEPYGMQSGGQP
jgi:hypothetical protein